MKISVVMATYNGAQYIEEQLDSIRLQTMQPDEVILCDDCSSDDTVKLIKKYICDYDLRDTWKVKVNKDNLGYANNFNNAAYLATGDFIFFSDQDDLWMLDKIKIMVSIMEQNSDCQVLCTDYELFCSNTNDYKLTRGILSKMPDDGKLEKISITKRSVYIGALGCCMCVRKKFYHSIKSYWFDGWAQDDRMWRLAQCVDGCYLLHSNLVKHRLHDNNTATYGKYHSIEKRVKLFKNMQDANKQMLRMLTGKNRMNKESSIIQKHIKMMELRIALLENSKIVNALILIAYLPYYQRSKSLLLELYMSIRRS